MTMTPADGFLAPASVTSFRPRVSRTLRYVSGVAIWSRVENWSDARRRFEDISSDAVGGEARQLREALDWFEEHLGSEWAGWRDRHPLAAQFSLTIGDGQVEAVRLFLLARELQKDPLLPEVVARLGEDNWRAHYTATFELEVAAGLRRKGCAVAFVAKKRGLEASPDLSVRVADRDVAIECTAVVQSEKEGHADAVMHSLFLLPQRCTALQRSVSVEFARGADAQDAFVRLSALEAAVLQASVEAHPVTIPGLATMTPAGDPQPHPSVVVNGGLAVGTWDQPFVQLARSIRRKVKGGQLSTAKPSVLCLRCRTFSLQMSRAPETWLRAVGAAVLDALEETDAGISAVLVYERWRGDPADLVDVKTRELAILCGPQVASTSRFLVLVQNPRAVHELTAEETAQLLSFTIG